MTYGEAIQIALYKTDSEKADYDSNIFPSIADVAQKKIAVFGKHIEKVYTINGEGEYTMPADFLQLSGKGLVNQLEFKPVQHYWKDKKTLVVEGTGTFDVHYFALPITIDENTADNYEFEVSIDTHVAIPFYIGYELTKTDDVQLAQMLLNEWNRYMSLFSDTPTFVEKPITNFYPLR